MEHFPLDLNEEEKKTYEMLLAFAQLSAGELGQYSEVNYDDASNVLQSLKDKGLATKVETFESRFIPKFPFLKTHEHFKQLIDRINATNSESKTFFSDRKSDLDTYQQTKHEELNQAVQQRIDEFNKHSSELKNKIDNTIAEYDSELNTIESEFIEKINAKHDSNINSEKEKVSNKRNEYHSKTETSQEKILQATTENKNEFHNITDNFTSSVETHNHGFLDDVKSRLSDLLEGFRSDLTTFETEYDSTGKDWTKKSLDVQMEAWSEFSESLGKLFTEVSTNLELQENALNQLNMESTQIDENSEILSYIRSLNDVFIEFKDKLMSGLQGRKDEFTGDRDSTNSTVQNFKNETINSINGIKSNYLENLDSNFTSFKDKVSTTSSTNRDQASELTKKIKSDFTALETSRKSGLDQIKIDMQNQQKIALELQKKTLHDLDTVILQTFNAQYQEMDRLKKNFFKDVTKATDLHYKTLETKMKEITLDLKTKFDEFTEVTRSKSDEAMTKANKEFDKFLKNEQKLTSKHLQDLKKPVEKMQTNTEKMLTDIETKFTEDSSLIDQTVKNQSEGMKTHLTNIKQQFVSDLTNELQTIVDSTNEENPDVSKLDLMKKIKEAISKRQAKLDADITKNVEEIQTKIIEPFDKSQAKIKETKDKFVGFLKSSSGEHFGNIATHLDDLEQDVLKKSEDFNSKVQKQIEASFTKLKGDYKKFIKEQYKTTEEHFKEEQKKTLPTHKKAAIGQIKEVNKLYAPELKRLNKVVTEFSTSSHTLLESLDSVIITGIPDNLNENITRTIKELESNSSTSHQSLTTFHEGWMKTNSDMESALLEHNSQNKTNHSTEIENMTSESLNVLERETSQSITFNESVHAKVTAHIQQDHDDFQELLKSSLGNIQAALNSIVKEQHRINKEIESRKLESFTEQANQIKDRYDKVNRDLQVITDTFRESSQGKVNERQTEVETLHTETKSKVSEDQNSFNAKFKSEIDDTTTKHDEQYRNHHSDLKSTADEFLQVIETDAVAFSDETRNDVISRMKGNVSLLKEKTHYVRDVHASYASSVEENNKTAETLRSNLIGITDSHYEKLINGNSGFSSELQKTVTDGIEILTPKITILEDYERLVNEFKFPRITSLPVIGRGAALHTMSEYLRNFKASVTLLIPNPSDIPVDLIAETKRPKRVTVASLFDLGNANEKSIVEKLIQQDNVTVRALSQQAGATGGEYPLYLSADRDSEEIFFGAHDPENKAEFAGMVSENRSYIEFIGKTITSDFLSRAKKIDRI